MNNNIDPELFGKAYENVTRLKDEDYAPQEQNIGLDLNLPPQQQSSAEALQLQPLPQRQMVGWPLLDIA